MNFLAPIFFYAALGVAAGAIALHFIVTRQPTSSPLPTVRFVPTSAVRVTTVAPVPEDLLLLLVRVLAVLLIGAALARPVIVPHRRPLARVVLADVSRAVGPIETVRDSARALLGSGDVLIAFDSSARVIRSGAADSASKLVRSAREGRLSPALIAGLRAAATIRDGADSIELAIVSPLRAAEIDGATQAIRALWPGRIRIVHVAGAADSLAPPAGVQVRADADDPIALATSVAGLAVSDSVVRVVRGAASDADSAWASGGRRTLVRWPITGAPPGWIARTALDTSGAVIAGEAALVTPLERRWRADSAIAITRVAARWVDGTPAAVERTIGQGCIRDVAITVQTRGDLALRGSFGRFVRALVAPCEAVSGGPAADSGALAALAGRGPLASHDAVRPPENVSTPLVPWLLAAAILFVLLELFVRRGSAPMWSDVAEEPERERRTGAVA
ncbi:MAG TPA: BatA domain-containing protein [Gemmatimonadaceae bacterium]|nr:BatA domain-containing protein [Gemmatimonadaceae bacterium]